MRAIRWHGRRDVRLDEVPEPGPPLPGEVTLAVEWCGICGTDLEEWRSGPHWVQTGEAHRLTGRVAPITLGHEVSARVVAIGPDVRDLAPGALVAVDGLVTCGRCWWCQRHQLTLCDSIGSIGMHADGGLADFITVPAVGCIALADHVGSDTAALAEPIAVAVRGLRRGRLAAGESVVIFGAGMIGLGALVAARAYGAGSITVVAPGQARRDLAISLGADVAIDPEEPRLADELRTSHGGRGPDLVIEASGAPQAIVGAIGSSRKGGRTVLIGFPPSGSAVNLLPVPVGEREIIGSLSHVWDEDLRNAVNLIEQGAITADRVGAKRISIEEAVAVFADVRPAGMSGPKTLVSPRRS